MNVNTAPHASQPLSPEVRVLLLCARTHLDGAARGHLQERVSGPLDWGLLLDLANRHHISTLLHHHLSTLDPGTVPPRVERALESRRVRLVARTMGILAEALPVLEALEAAGAPAAIWKGPALAHQAYPRPELRIFTDLDLVVRLQDVETARRVLEGRGYRASDETAASDDEVFGRRAGAVRMVGQGKIAPVDLHWGSAHPSRPMDCERLWEEARSVPLGSPRAHGGPLAHGGAPAVGSPLGPGGASLRAVPPVSQIPGLCAHGAKHGPYPWPKLKWVTDLEAILRTSDAGWCSVLEQAEETGHRRMTLLGIRLARDLLGAPVPAELEAAIAADPALPDLVDTVRARLLHVAPLPLPLGERFRFDLRMRERTRDRVTYLVARTLTPSERDIASAPRSRPVLRIPRRLGRLALRYLFAPSRARTVPTSSTRLRR